MINCIFYVHNLNMKKFIVIVIISLIICCSTYIKQDFTLSSYFTTGKISYYTSIPNTNSTKLADTYINTQKPQSNIIGESMYFTNIEVITAIKILKARVEFAEYLDEQDLTLIYCYTNLIPTYKNVKSHKINLQISVSEEYTIIGWPLIYGSF